MTYVEIHHRLKLFTPLQINFLKYLKSY